MDVVRGDRHRRALRLHRAVLHVVAAALLVLALGTSHASGPVTTTAFVPYWDQARGFAEIDRYGDALSVVSPWWYAPSSDGAVVVQHEGHTDIDLATVRTLQERGFAVTPAIANHHDGAWDFDVVGEILASETATRAHVRALTDLVVDNDFDGLQLDYENLEEEDAERYADLVRRLAAAFDEHRKTLAVAIHGKLGAETDGWGAGHDYAQLGAHAHELHLMAYDLHNSGSSPGPSAPLWWVDEVLDYATSLIPAEKLVLGIGLYGYDWRGNGPAEGLTLQEVEARVQRFDGDVEFDEQHQTPVFRYEDESDLHQLWFEDARSLEGKLELVDAHDLGGVFFWRMGGTTAATWDIVAATVEPAPR